MSNVMLEVDSIKTGYGAIEAVRGISLRVEEGKIVTLIGANGSGKTTTLLSIAGIQKLWSGTISFAGQTISGLAAHEIVHRGLALVPEGRKIFPRLTVLENLEMGAYVQKDRLLASQDLEHVFSLFPVLKERMAQAGGTLSGGEQQMLAIGRALMCRPKMLLMDEPSMGIAPLVVQRIFETITKLNKEGLTILLVEQNANLALRVASHGYVLENGKIILDDSGSALISNPRVQEAYLG